MFRVMVMIQRKSSGSKLDSGYGLYGLASGFRTGATRTPRGLKSRFMLPIKHRT